MGRHSFADRSRPYRIVLAAIAAAWALVTLPLPLSVWDPGGGFWPEDITVIPAYDAAVRWAGDPYIVFGALAGLSFLAIGLALLPDLHRAGWGGITMGWTILATAPITALSYLSTPVDAPLHFLWGAEALGLLAISLTGLLAAFSAGRRWGRSARILLASTFVFIVVFTIGLGYYPHGSLVGLGLVAVAVIAAAPRDRAFAAPTDATDGGVL
ncbi:hypothetical protein ACFT30_01335 [Microbacterium ureisolvens]|uniref:hypothetical protein n=1 Tax=Microbacterium ureisolvens TaxID=2781186 RepID=UPI0036328CCE